MADGNYRKLQDKIMDFLLDLHDLHDIIYISNNQEGSVIGEQIYDILKPKVKEKKQWLKKNIYPFQVIKFEKTLAWIKTA